MRISDWSSDVCSSDLEYLALRRTGNDALARAARQRLVLLGMSPGQIAATERSGRVHNVVTIRTPVGGEIGRAHVELQSLMRITYAVFCLKNQKPYTSHLL